MLCLILGVSTIQKFVIRTVLSLFDAAPSITPSPRVTRILVPGKDRVMRKPC